MVWYLPVVAFFSFWFGVGLASYAFWLYICEQRREAVRQLTRSIEEKPLTFDEAFPPHKGDTENGDRNNNT